MEIIISFFIGLFIPRVPKLFTSFKGSPHDCVTASRANLLRFITLPSVAAVYLLYLVRGFKRVAAADGNTAVILQMLNMMHEQKRVDQKKLQIFEEGPEW